MTRSASTSLPKLVATDLDGTLVRSDGTVSERAHRTLDRLRRNGVRLVGATGRGPRLIELTRRDLGPADYLVLAAGAYCYDVSGPEPELLRARTIPGPTIARAVELVENAVGPVQLAVEALTAPYSPLWRDADFDWPYPEPTEPADRADALSGPLVKAFIRSTTVGLDDLLAACLRVLPPGLCELSHVPGMLELVAAGCTKASGLALVAGSLGIDPGDVLAFGDMPNDLPMLRWAGRAVAVANAHESIRAAADEATTSNDDDGVAAYLERLLDG